MNNDILIILEQPWRCDKNMREEQLCDIYGYLLDYTGVNLQEILIAGFHFCIKDNTYKIFSPRYHNKLSLHNFQSLDIKHGPYLYQIDKSIKYTADEMKLILLNIVKYQLNVVVRSEEDLDKYKLLL